MPRSILGGRSKPDETNYPTPKDYAEAKAAMEDPDPITRLCPWALVRRHPEGGYAVVEGFVEDVHIPAVDPDVHENFVTLQAAVNLAAREAYWSISPECYRPPVKLVKGL